MGDEESCSPNLFHGQNEQEGIVYFLPQAMGLDTIAAFVSAGYASSMSRKAEADKCYLCGAPATTSDHIPPRGVFPSPRPANLITVPACKACNQGCSLDDEYFRTVVSAVSRDSPQSLYLLKQRILPRVREKPAMGIALLKSVRRVDVYSKGGIFLGQAPQVTFDSARIVSGRSKPATSGRIKPSHFEVR